MSTLLEDAINQVEDAINQVQVLPEAEQERIASIILQEVSKGASERLNFLPKLSDILLLPELEESEILFERSDETSQPID